MTWQEKSLIMHIHILGICGTFMGGIALIARQLGHTVSGSDQNVYPPMSTQLEAQGIKLHEGYTPEILQQENADLIVIGNAMSRGNPAVEFILERGLAYTSGPQWLADYALKDRWVLAVAGTHGKTSTASMLAWILEDAKMDPGFLIGGIPENFGLSARITESPFFVVEADEYDTAFFDKRSKFVHYHPRTVVLNNLEYDHIDIFPSLDAIKTQFHHLLRIVPSNGLIILPSNDKALDDVIEMGCWTPCETIGEGQWQSKAIIDDYSQFEVLLQTEEGLSSYGTVKWELIGRHNMMNGLAAIAAARHAGVPVNVSIEALASFKSVKRRMELKGVIADISVYDDFAHHPTAIATTLEALRAKVGNKRIIAVTDLRSNTMRSGLHKNTIRPALENSDINLIHKPLEADWELDDSDENTSVYSDTEELLSKLITLVSPGDQVLIMSNGGFDGIHQKLLNALTNKYPNK
ncbi:MAG: UDP-N-acetylmuramate: L-alanyl-gamma-D-glutamyl-meso-diaminopimelate ligase [Enterobacterales bacterium]|jgi:UDP-N-acetylmuramate: L-alanyl-gamma-D-glutamyl-meso-diaminopimelate ligase